MRERFKGDYSKMADFVYAKSIFTNRERLDKFIADPSLRLFNPIRVSHFITALEIIFKLRDKYDDDKKVIHQTQAFVEACLR